MANTIKLKQSNVLGKVPLVGDLVLGEPAINTANGRMYIKKDVGGVESIVDIGNNQAIADLQSDISSVEGDISTLQSDVSAAQGDITNLQSDVSTAIGDISTLQSDVSTAQGNISTLQSDVAAAQGDISQLQSDVAEAQGDIGALETRVTTAEGSITTLQSGLSSAETSLTALQKYKDEQTIYVAKNGNDSTGNGGEHAPYATLSAAMAAITDATPSKRYIIKVKAGAYTQATALNLKANVFIVGEARDAVRLTASSFGLDASFTGSGDNRSGMANLIVVSGNSDYNWATVTSAAGKLYFTDVSFSTSVSLYGHNNAIAQAQFHNCTFFSTLTISGINLGVHRSNIHYGNVTLNQHPNGGMPTILVADGGTCSGTVTATTTVNDFNRRCAVFARNFYMEYLTINGPSSYCDLTDNSVPRDATRVTKSNGGNLVYLNTTAPIDSNTRNMGDVGHQYLYNFNYVNASTGTDLYVISMGTSYAADSSGKGIFIEADSYGLNADVNGGDVNVTTAATSGTGVRGKIKLDGREVDVASKKIVNLADGSASSDAINKGQLDSAVTSLESADSALQATLSGAVSDIATLQLDVTAAEGDIELLQSGLTTAEGEIDLLQGTVVSLSSDLTDLTNDVSAVSGRVDALEATPRVQVYDDYSSFPGSGSEEVVYITADNNELYRWEVVTLPESYDFTVGATGDFASLDAALASASVQDGHKIYVQAGTYSVSSTINVSKQVKIYGAGVGQAIFETAGGAGDPVSMFNVSVDNVLFKGLTIKHKKTSNTSVETAVVVSGGGFPQTRVANFIMDDCRVEHVEFAVTVRGSGWKLANSQFAYEGPNNSTRRHVGVYGVSGNCFIVNNVSSNNASTGSLRWIQITSTTGSNPNETLVGKLIVQNNSQTYGALAQFISQDAWQGTLGSFELIVKSNVTQETSAFVSFYGTVANFGDTLSAVTVSGNNISNTHGGANNGGKGVIGVDGTGAFRSVPLAVHAAANTLANETYRTDYVSVEGTTVGRNANITSFSAAADSVIPSNPTEPTTPSAGGGTSQGYVALNVNEVDAGTF